jgi:DNA-binding NtrC family response regulator
VEAVGLLRQGGIDLVLLDQRMPRLGGSEAIRALIDVDPEIDVVVVTAFGSVEAAVDALKAGAVDYLSKPVDLDRLQIVVRKALERRTLLRENRELRQKLAGGPRLEGIISGSGVMEELINTVGRAAPTEATVLIAGESGTGKELIARAIHAASRRSAGPFVAVHCAALAEGVLESELFGHEKGAFTGAGRARAGRFEAAAGGTLFLDEVGEIPLSVQVKLLRVLQERRVERVGSNRGLALDVRLVAATHRDLIGEIRTGSFREDLYYRLAVVRLFVPPLRHRREDIPRLVEHFIGKHGGSGTHPVKGISREAMDLLLRYDYPGNVRELENLIQSAVVLSRGEILASADLPPALHAPALEREGNAAVEVGEGGEGPGREGSEGIEDGRAGDPGSPIEGFLPRRVEALERRLIEEALRAADGVQCRAAERLGISERTLRYKLEKYKMK